VRSEVQLLPDPPAYALTSYGGLDETKVVGEGGLAKVNMKYVYILCSIAFPDRHYTGITSDLKMRLARHNVKEVSHTAKYAPWRLKTYMAFSDGKQAFEFEKYLKTASGRAFAKKRL
jgi:putative endonuclease